MEELLSQSVYQNGYDSGRLRRWLSETAFQQGLGSDPWKKAPILGRVCMDQFMVDVTDIPEVKAGDEVTLMGRDGDEFISVETLGDISGRFSYEFVCEISKRVPRVYIKDGKECGEEESFFQ